jgi:hypothetical protein
VFDDQDNAAYEEYRARPATGHSDGFDQSVCALKHAFLAGIGHARAWRPIETAPKDGTDIIVGFDVATQWVIHMAYWSGPENSDWQDMVDLGSCTDEDIGWWSYVRGSVSRELLNGHRTPTHWIPMPCLKAA